MSQSLEQPETNLDKKSFQIQTLGPLKKTYIHCKTLEIGLNVKGVENLIIHFSKKTTKNIFGNIGHCPDILDKSLKPNVSIIFKSNSRHFLNVNFETVQKRAKYRQTMRQSAFISEK